MNKSEKLKPERKIKFKCFLLANVLTLFFALASASSAGGPIALAADNSFDAEQKSGYSEPFSKLIEFLNDKKNELAEKQANFEAKIETRFRRNTTKLPPSPPVGQAGGKAGSSLLSAVFETVRDLIVDKPKQYLGTIVDSAKDFVFPGAGQNNFEYKSSTGPFAAADGETAREMEILKTQYEEAINEANALNQKFNLLQNELEKIKNSGVVVREPVIEQRVVERTIEKIISGLSQNDLDSGLSSLKTELNNLNTNLTNQINNLSAQTNRQNSAVYQAVSLTNKIDSLSGTRLSNITVSGVTGLADSDIPDGITASNYLPLAGGTITGSTTISGQTNLSNATTSLLTVSNGAWFTSGNVGIGTSSPYAKLSVVGPVVAEYFHATSTTATSTFNGTILAAKTPTLPHTFSVWDTDVANSNVLNSSFIINPSSAVADSNLFGIAVGGNVKFLIDAEGDVFVRNLTATGTVNQANTSISTLTVENAATFGDADTDTLAIRSGVWSLTSTATSTVAMTNGLNFDSNTLVIDPNSNRIGLGTTSPYAKLSVVGETVSSYFTATTSTASTFPYASTTAITVSGTASTTNLVVSTGSILGTISSGLWSGTTIGNTKGGTGIDSSALTGIAQIVAGTWSASSTLSTAFGGTGWGNLQANTVLLGNGAGRLATTTAGTDGFVLGLSAGVPTWLATSTLSTITGTLAVAKGGTGQTSFGQGWLNSDGTTLSASTSPTVAWLTATSTTATSTFPYLSVTTNSNLGTVVGGTWQGSAIGATYGGTGINSSALTGLAQIVAGTWSASSTLSTAFGGTGWGNLQANTVLLGNGAGRLATTTAGTDGFVLGLSAGVPTWLATSTLSTITGTLAVAKGGTGAATLTGLLQGNGTSAITGVAGTAGQFPYYNGTDTLLATSSLFLATSGNVGIGTTTPDSKLTVFNDAADSAMEFSSASGSTYKWTIGLDYSDAGKFKIASSTALGSIDRFTIDGNGYVGIGTSTPARRLDVADSGNNNPQMRLSRETNIYTDFSVAQTTGDLSLSLYGTNADDISLYMPDGSTGANLWVCEGAACPNGISFTGGGNLFVEGVIKYATSTTPKTRRSIILTAAGAIVPTTSGAAKTQVDGTNHSYYVLDYDASSDEAAFWQWTMPDSYDNGSIDVTYYWEAGATSGDAVLCFQAKGLSANSSEDIDSALSSALCETDTAQANANDLASIAETNATSNFTAGEYITFKVFRDADVAGDTMTGDARLVKVKLEYGVATESD